MNIREDKLKAAIQIALGMRGIYTEEIESALVHHAKALSIDSVVKSLPTDEEIYSEGCKYVRKIEQPNRQPIITLRRTFKAGAEFVKKQLDN